MVNEPFIFLSYRRSDTTPYALAVKAELEQRLRTALVFVDVHRIQGGEHWPASLDSALARARVLIALIGPNWLGHDKAKAKPRIFDDNDWVRKELRYFLREKPEAVLPILVDGTSLSNIKLPEDLAALRDVQPLKLTPAQWKDSIVGICNRLIERFDFQPAAFAPQNPGVSHFRQLTAPLDAVALDKFLKEAICDWKLDFVYGPDESAVLTQWLVRTYDFRTFEEAVQFLQTGALECAKLNHHPTWENCFKKVVVRTTTWNAGYRITQFDVELARRLDRVAAKLSR
jgi:pterin-4a-carbinolamine dehydratase